MEKNKYIRKTSFMLVIALAILMVAAASANADRNRDEQILDPIHSVVITHDSTEGEKGDPIVEPVGIEEPLVIAPYEDIGLEDAVQEDDLVISPYGDTIGIDDENPENLIIATKTEKVDDNTFSKGLTPLLGIAIICGLLILFLVIRRKK